MKVHRVAVGRRAKFGTTFKGLGFESAEAVS